MLSPQTVLQILIRSGLTLRLYANDREPMDGDAPLLYDEPANYTPQQLSELGWSIDGNEAAYPEHTFVFSGPAGRVYGYFIVAAPDGRWLCGERFDVPFEVRIAGDKVQVTPRLVCEVG